MAQYGRDQRDYIRFRESDSYDPQENQRERHFREFGSFNARNRFGEERVKHDRYQDDQFRNDYDPTYKDEYGMKHPYEHGGKRNRWSDDIRSSSSKESYAGRGPKGYARSEERMREEACEILARDFELDASNIEVEVKDRVICLSGVVRSRKDKRLAEILVENISGVEDVMNLISVSKGEPYGQGQIN